MSTSKREKKKRDGICEQSHCTASSDQNVIPRHVNLQIVKKKTKESSPFTKAS